LRAVDVVQVQTRCEIGRHIVELEPGRVGAGRTWSPAAVDPGFVVCRGVRAGVRSLYGTCGCEQHPKGYEQAFLGFKSLLHTSSAGATDKGKIRLAPQLH
jgi:hypothetical protein